MTPSRFDFAHELSLSHALSLLSLVQVDRPALGISYVSAAQARALGVKYGVLVLDVPKGTEASKAGLLGSTRLANGQVLLGDVIIGINGETVESDLDLFRAIDRYSPGESVRVKVSRLQGQMEKGGKLDEVEATLNLKLQATTAA